ncbi:conserved hypothetical protein [Burkholderia cenocepacia]|nr:conserved hypothetical protein [Burkholderia cenocepacia]
MSARQTARDAGTHRVPSRRKRKKVASALAQTSGDTAGQRIDMTSKRHQHTDSDQAEPRSYQKQIHGHTTVLS